jgi:hypothetical protein
VIHRCAAIARGCAVSNGNFVTDSSNMEPLANRLVVPPSAASDAPAGSHRIRVAFIAVTIVFASFAWSRSLLLTSTPIDVEQFAVVTRAVGKLEQAGFSKEVFVLRYLANYRATDNWWNRHVGHSQAYAATNFPLGVVTLYEPFFRIAVDDTERAAILLHEAQHLLGAGETSALETTWRQKARLGWTEERYGETKVWKNTREWTLDDVPSLFHCGADGDCAP